MGRKLFSFSSVFSRFTRQAHYPQFLARMQRRYICLIQLIMRHSCIVVSGFFFAKESTYILVVLSQYNRRYVVETSFKIVMSSTRYCELAGTVELFWSLRCKNSYVLSSSISGCKIARTTTNKKPSALKLPELVHNFFLFLTRKVFYLFYSLYNKKVVRFAGKK